MTAPEIRSRIVRWELLRLPFNLICIVGAWFAWGLSNHVTVGIDEMPPSSLSDPGALSGFLFGFAVLNIAYCLIYAVEFVGAAITPKFAHSVSVSAYVMGCIIGCGIAAFGAGNIAQSLLTEKKIGAMQKVDAENVQRWREEETRRRNEAREKETRTSP